MTKVIGLGGVFFKGEDPTKLYQWYEKHLGIKSESWGAKFPWKRLESEDETYSAWSIFSTKTKYLDPSKKDFMINYQVHNLKELLEELKSQGVEILGQEESEFGKFAWIIDPEENKIELWEAPK